MIRRNFIKGLSLFTTGLALPKKTLAFPIVFDSPDARSYWLDMLLKITSPVLTGLSLDKLKEVMPVESANGQKEERKLVTHLEALGRSLAGLSPWLEGTSGNAAENKKRKEYIEKSVSAIRKAVDPKAKSYLNFTEGRQPLVDAAFLAHALIRAPRSLWGNLDASTKKNLINALQSTRAIQPYYSNWLLFSAMVEAALLKFSGNFDPVRVDYALREHELWYKGDGVYGDGPDFHFDYYNSFVIQPMLIDVLDTLEKNGKGINEMSAKVAMRAQRYAQILERMISPEGTFPPIGRSLAYRCGAFQLLAQLALQQKLPSSLPAAQVRSALTAVIKRTLESPGIFDSNGWLTIGFAGHQPEIGENYISTGSLYLCTTAFLPLGLPENDTFWSGESQEWTSRKAFGGKPFPIDKAL
jgi:hypothetical protein